MAFPQTPLGTTVQCKINGTWTDVTRYDTNTKILQDAGVSITRGQGGLQTKTPPGTCTWTWQDPNGIYNNENPRSPYYNLLPRNTPVRVYVPRTTPALFIVDVNDGARAQTLDKALLAITGDLEIRIDFEPRRFTRWSGGANREMFLCTKRSVAAGNRSWDLRIGDSGGSYTISNPLFSWSFNGTNTISVISTAPLPTTGRISLKVTLDVDNGAAGSDVKFWTSTTGINGTYTQLGATRTTAGVTSVFAGNANLEIGTGGGGALDNAFSTSVENYYGRVYGFQIWNGISGSGGTMVGNADFTAQTNGTTSFADGLGNTWTLAGVAEITNADYRFHGELSAPVTHANRSLAGLGADVKVEAEAGGLIRRLTSNAQQLQAPIDQIYSGYAANGWWPGSDATTADTSEASSGLTDVNPAALTDITFAGHDATLAGAKGVMTCGSTGPTFVGTCKTVAATSETHFIGFFKFPSIPLSAQTLFSLYSPDGTISRWDFIVDATGYTLKGYNSAGTLTVNRAVAFGAGANPTDWIAWHMQLTNSAGTISVKHEWMSITSGAAWADPGPITYAGANGIINKVGIQAIAALSGVKIAELMSSTQVGLVFWDGVNNTFARASAGFPGETADARFIRVCGILGIQPVIIGRNGDSELMGAQPIGTGMDILYECADVDGGIIGEAIDQLALEYRTRKSLYNQYGMTLTWANLTTVQKTPDDTDVANDITLSRDNGGSARATLAYGPMSTQAPPNGISTVQDGPTINNYQDSRLPLLVQNMLLKRTWPTSRWPNITIEMHRSDFVNSSTLALQATKTEITDMITVTTLPNFLAPEPVYLLVKGTIEDLATFTRTINFACVPYGPYQTTELTTNTGDPYIFKACPDTVLGVVQTQVNTSFNASATALSIKTLSGPLIDTAMTSGTIKIGGERMTVTSVTGSSSPQTVNVTRGLDGYTAAHTAGDYVYIDLTLKARL
jgi:hypothetical protein